jgi:plasmid stability protein
VLLCTTVANITVSVPDEVYRAARIRAAERDTSVSALVADYLRSLSGREAEFERLEAQRRRLIQGIDSFSARSRLGRDEVHERAVR